MDRGVRSVRPLTATTTARALVAPILFLLLLATMQAIAVPAAAYTIANQWGKVPVGYSNNFAVGFFFCNPIPIPDTMSKVSGPTGADKGDITITSDNCIGYTQNVSESCSATNPSEYCEIDFTFAPQGAGKRTWTITLTDQNNNVWDVNNTGYGGIIVTPPQYTPQSTPVPSSNIFPLMSPTTTAPGSASITFTAADISSTIKWAAATNYKTMRGITVSATRDKFTTNMPNEATTRTYSGIGGQMTITATAQGYTDTTTAYITGTPIPNSDIRQVTTNAFCPSNCCSAGTCTTLNGGQPPTPNLFTMIAADESSCRQFADTYDAPPISIQPYPLSQQLWPDEPNMPPDNDPLGLLMVQINNGYFTGMETAWNWLDNVQASLDLFDWKVKNYALVVQNAAVKKYKNSAGSVNPGLQNLLLPQLENMALGEYGTVAGKIPNLQYYIPKCMGGTSSKNNVCTCTGGCSVLRKVGNG